MPFRSRGGKFHRWQAVLEPLLILNILQIEAANRYQAKTERAAKKALQREQQEVPEDELDQIFHTVTQDEIAARE